MLSKRMKFDRNIVLAAVKQDPSAIWCDVWRNPVVMADRDIIKVAVAADGRVLAHASSDLKDDSQIVSVAVDSFGPSLEFASKEKQADRGVVLDAVRSAGCDALKFASPALLDDVSFAKEAADTWLGTIFQRRA